MSKKIMFGIIQLVNIGDIISTYLFYTLAKDNFIEISPFFSLAGENIYIFLAFKYIMLVILSIGVYTIFSTRYFIAFYIIIFSLYAYAIAHNTIAYNTYANILYIESIKMR